MPATPVGESFLPDEELTRLLADLTRAADEFARAVHGVTGRGNPYAFGGMRPEVGQRLFALVREFRPRILVETGVCNGVSTAVLLAALARNGEGHLYSVDLPEHTDTTYPPGSFWEGKLGAVVPRGQQPGWLVPDRLRGHWTLRLGRSQEVLPHLLEELGSIDFFLHDSEHSYECMSFEYDLAWRHLRPGGLLVSDDTTWNTAFADFSRAVEREPDFLDRKVGFLVK